MFKLRLYKFLSTFIPYFKRKFMTEIQNVLKRIFDDLINQYDNKNLFTIIIISNSLKPNCTGYTITHESASMIVRIEYFDNKIVFEFSSMTFNTREELSKMNNLVEYIESIPQEKLKTNI